MRKAYPFNKNEIIFLSVSMVVFISICFSVALWKYNTLRNSWPPDLAFFNHWFWNFTHGYKFVTLTPAGLNGPDIFKVAHFSVIRFLLAPLYSLLPCIQTLFFLQVTIFSSGIIGAYLIGRSYGKNSLIGVVLAVFYMFFPPIFNLAIYDFNPLCLALPFLIFSFYFYSKENPRWFIVFALLALSAREQVIVSIMLLGSLSFLTKERFSDKIRWFLWPVGLCLLYSILFILHNMHAYHHPIPWIGFLKDSTLCYLSDSNFLDSVRNTSLFLFKDYSWWLFLAVLSPLFLLIALPNFLYLFLLYDELVVGPYYPDLKYITIPTAAIFICCGLSLCKVYRYLRYKKKVFYLIILILFLFLIGGWLQNLISIFNYPRQLALSEIKELHSLSKQIKTGDAVLTSCLLSPLFSSREEIYCYEDLGPYFDWSYVLKRADYIIIQKAHSDIYNRLSGVDMFKKTKETENLIFYKKAGT